jgi:hypothetical protein
MSRDLHRRSRRRGPAVVGVATVVGLAGTAAIWRFVPEGRTIAWIAALLVLHVAMHAFHGHGSGRGSSGHEGPTETSELDTRGGPR